MRYFKLVDTVGKDPDGSLQPIGEVGLPIRQLGMVGVDVVSVGARVVLKPLAAHTGEGAVGDEHRTVKTANDGIADVLLESGQYVEVDPPKTEHPHKAKTGAAGAAAKSTDQED